MKKWGWAVLWVIALAGAASTAAPAQTSATQTLSASVYAEAGLFSLPGSLVLSRTGTVFNRFSGSMALQYRARTSQNAGTATITVKATSDFTPTGGPSIAAPPSAGDALTYTCSGATLGTGCSGTMTVSTGASTNVVTIGAGACTGSSPCPSNTADPNSVNLSFLRTNDPKYKTGPYAATLTFTISAS